MGIVCSKKQRLIAIILSSESMLAPIFDFLKTNKKCSLVVFAASTELRDKFVTLCAAHVDELVDFDDRQSYCVDMVISRYKPSKSEIFLMSRFPPVWKWNPVVDGIGELMLLDRSFKRNYIFSSPFRKMIYSYLRTLLWLIFNLLHAPKAHIFSIIFLIRSFYRVLVGVESEQKRLILDSYKNRQIKINIDRGSSRALFVDSPLFNDLNRHRRNLSDFLVRNNDHSSSLEWFLCPHPRGLYDEQLKEKFIFCGKDYDFSFREVLIVPGTMILELIGLLEDTRKLLCPSFVMQSEYATLVIKWIQLNFPDIEVRLVKNENCSDGWVRFPRC